MAACEEAKRAIASVACEVAGAPRTLGRPSCADAVNTADNCGEMGTAPGWLRSDPSRGGGERARWCWERGGENDVKDRPGRCGVEAADGSMSSTSAHQWPPWVSPSRRGNADVSRSCSSKLAGLRVLHGEHAQQNLPAVNHVLLVVSRW